MFQKLKHRWEVSGANLLLIICTFAIGGSLCGIAGRKILAFTGIDNGVVWVLLYIVLVTLLWPLCVLVISIPLGQFGFFRRYIQKILGRVYGKKNTDTIQVAIFASGTGSNAQKIIEHFTMLGSVKIALIVCNKPGAGVLKVAENAKIPAILIEKSRFFDKNDHYLPELKKYHIGFIVLAGFLWKIPAGLVHAFSKKILNIHPALLPKYGGKGMYGHFVHEAVIRNGDKESGITIHFVDEVYDHGEVILQEKCTIAENETPDSLAQKIHALEHLHFPKTIETLLLTA